MGLLGGITYDPTTAVSKATTATLAMTAIDTTNLRVSFTAPSNGAVLVRLQATLHGAATYPQILLGVMEGSTVMGKVVPTAWINGVAAATTFLTVEGLFIVRGLTSGSAHTFDAAYGVETTVASTGLKYGGPNNATANDAFGAFLFDIFTT